MRPHYLVLLEHRLLLQSFHGIYLSRVFLLNKPNLIEIVSSTREELGMADYLSKSTSANHFDL
jgi:hypothetical protein